MQSIDPTTGQILEGFEPIGSAALEDAIASAAAAAGPWSARPVAERAGRLRTVGAHLREHRSDLARVITREMGKLIGEAESEVEKCALVCDYYADQGERLLTDIPIDSDASRSGVVHQPLGVLLAVMPWNFPFWQVFRCAAPALVAGNALLLKHASNVPRCALAIERIFGESGLPEGLFKTLLIESGRVADLIADPRVRGVSLTGSEAAGRAVAEAAGRHLKKSLLELGGSDAFVVLEDADLDHAVETALRSRFMNAGQSCIAAKRFIPVRSVADDFTQRLLAAIRELRPGDPLDPETTLAPMAREDLREELHRQVQDSLDAGARLLTGGHPLDQPGWFYAPTLLDGVGPGMPAYSEELFGPVAVVIRAEDEPDALRIANDTRFGLGGSVWTLDTERGERFARAMDCGAAFVNGLVKSDPRLPFGGVKDSGYGRELGAPGIQEFLNAKTLWIG
ncbi:NAD-dependent succinate-semialdehyde dehydrogenase [Imhoffiella purpurea]